MSKIIKNGVTYGGMPTVSGNISYDNTSSGLNAITVQNAITELKEIYDLPKGYAWAGTQDEWDALSAQEKQIYDDKVVLITDEGSRYKSEILYENTDFTPTSGTSNVTRNITLTDSIANYDAIQVWAWMCVTSSEKDQLIETTIPVSMVFVEGIGEDADIPFLLNGSVQDSGRRIWIGFTDNTHMKMISVRTQSDVDCIPFRVYGLQYNGEAIGGSSGDLTAADVAFSDTTRSASLYNNVTNVDEALMAIKSGINSLDAEDITYTPERSTGTFCGGEMTVAGALDQIDDVLVGLSADEIGYTPSSGSIYGNNVDTVEEALGALNTVISGLDTEDIALPSASKTGIYANADDVQDALDAIKTALSSGGGGASTANDVSYTSSESHGIYVDNSVATVKEALDITEEYLYELSASDVSIGACGFYESCDNVAEAFETVESALNDLAGSYSTSEVELSATWIDDSHIYQKTFYFDPSVTLTATQWTALSDTTISGLADIIDVKGIFAIVDGNTETPCNAQYIMTKYDSGLSVYLIGATAVPSSTSLILKAITVQYTKT